ELSFHPARLLLLGLLQQLLGPAQVLQNLLAPLRGRPVLHLGALTGETGHAAYRLMRAAGGGIALVVVTWVLVILAVHRSVPASGLRMAVVGGAFVVVVAVERRLDVALALDAQGDTAVTLVARGALEPVGLGGVHAELAGDARVGRAAVRVGAAVVRVARGRLARHLPQHADRESRVPGLGVVTRIVRHDPDLAPADAVAADV